MPDEKNADLTDEEIEILAEAPADTTTPVDADEASTDDES